MFLPAKTHECIDADLTLEMLTQLKGTFHAMTSGTQLLYDALSLEGETDPAARAKADKARKKANREWASAVRAGFCKPAPLVRFSMPYQITDAHPHVYRHCRGLFSKRAASTTAAAAAVGAAVGASDGGEDGRILVIGLHVRRGELHLVDSQRMLPNSHYINIAQRVIKACSERGVRCKVELCTEVAHQARCVRVRGRIGVGVRVAWGEG